jgi:flagellar biosynthetic protein FlhB
MGGGSWSLSAAVGAGVQAAITLVRVAALVGLAVAGLDYLMERRRVEKGMRMSRDEIKREHRQSEGDPHQKGALRGRQREISRNRMMADVATADVVLVNPTHVAVALRYESGSGAPRVVAKGAGVIAARIREEAEKHRRPMVADVPLARTLYAACEVGQEIPVDLYDAVAKVLAFIMALRTRGSVTGVHTVRPLALTR